MGWDKREAVGGNGMERKNVLTLSFADGTTSGSLCDTFKNILMEILRMNNQ